MKSLYLQRETTLDILKADITCRRMSWLYDVEKVGVCTFVEQGERRGLLPCVNPVGVEINDGVTFDRGHWSVVRFLEINMVFERGKKGKDVLLELKTDEFFGPQVAHVLGPARIVLVPGVIYGLRKEIYPAPVGCGER